MHADAILLMVVSMILLWGGLAVSVTALWVRGRREEVEERAAAFERAHAHFREAMESSESDSVS